MGWTSSVPSTLTPAGPGLDREQLYWELSHESQGVTHLGSFILDGDSLYVSVEGLGYSRALCPYHSSVLPPLL